MYSVNNLTTSKPHSVEQMILLWGGMVGLGLIADFLNIYLLKM